MNSLRTCLPCLLQGCLAALLALSTGAAAQSCGDAKDLGDFCGDGPRERWEEGWQEERTALPALPETENLMRIDANRADQRYEYFVDKASINQGKDGVMRYTVVIQSSSGARNVFHEGLRCETDEVRTYAYAGSSGGFTRSTSSPWKPLAVNGVRAYQEFLAAVIMCNPSGFAWDASKAVYALGRQYTSGGVRVESACRTCAKDWDTRRND